MKKNTQKLFQYEIVKKIGQGAFGQVLLGTKNGEQFAIKKISKKQIIKVNKLHEPFIEKQILHKLKQETKQYPYFVKIYETQSDEDNIYLILQFCAGGTLEQYILSHEYEHLIMKKIAARILLILQKLHSYKIVHRDIKPSNILFTEDGFVKLSDFGTAYAPDQFFSKQIAQQIRGIKEMSQRKESIDGIDEDQKKLAKEKSKQNVTNQSKKSKQQCENQKEQQKGKIDKKEIGQKAAKEEKKESQQETTKENKQGNQQNVVKEEKKESKQESAKKQSEQEQVRKEEQKKQKNKEQAPNVKLKQQQVSNVKQNNFISGETEFSESQLKIRQSADTMDTFYSIERRSTFVGTACYMAPQLLQNDLCGKEADLWAFGCILYEMIFKKSPFFDINEGMVWKKITNNEVKIQLSSDAKNKEQYTQIIDLIKKILIKDINKRLGFGQNGYSQIKKHPYFDGIEWQTQSKKTILEIAVKIQTVKQQVVQKPKQKVVFSGVVGKKAFFGNFKQRMLILYSTPKLVYYCTESGDKKGELPLEKNTPLTVEGKIFSVSNQKKTYYFKAKTSGQWVEMIKNAIVNAYY